MKSKFGIDQEFISNDMLVHIWWIMENLLHYTKTKIFIMMYVLVDIEESKKQIESVKNVFCLLLSKDDSSSSISSSTSSTTNEKNYNKDKLIKLQHSNDSPIIHTYFYLNTKKKQNSYYNSTWFTAHHAIYHMANYDTQISAAVVAVGGGQALLLLLLVAVLAQQQLWVVELAEALFVLLFADLDIVKEFRDIFLVG